jgi:peptide/nickel transport system ATP-binding protein
MTPVLTVRGLSVASRNGPILQGIDLDLMPGRVLGLIGESGAGKSTLGLAAIGYLKAGCSFTGGTATLLGHDVTRLPAADLRALRRARVSYVAQSAAAAFNPFWRLERQVTELAAPEGRGALARDLFARLQLPDPDSFGRRYPHQVSGGQLQRAMIAMALANRPDLVVFDEPTTALDVTTQREVLLQIREVVAQQGCAALYISHDLAVVSQMADDILVLRHGRMVESGPARQVVEAPATDYARALVAHRQGGATPPHAVATPVLAASDLSIGYGGRAVVQGVSLQVNRGEALAIVGESGSGKTTLARALAGLVAPLRGQVLLEGHSLAPRVEGRSPQQRRRLQFIHQLPDVALNPRQTLRQILGRPLTLFRQPADPDAALNALMADVGLPAALLDRYPGALSGGQKQRVCIARALAADPELLLCDEITSALDPLVEDGILALLSGLLVRRGVGIVLITHNLGLTRSFAHRVVVMEQGRIVETGPTDALFAAPDHPYTRRLLAAEPRMAAGWLDRARAATNPH